MPLYHVSFEVQNAEIVRQGLEDLSAEIAKVGRRRLYNHLRKLRAEITKTPSTPPPQWEEVSDKQRNFIHFALHEGKGKNSDRQYYKWLNIPYKRTGRYKKAWKIVRTDKGYDLIAEGYYIPKTGMRVGNPAIFYIGGDPEGGQQSYMHRGRWRKVAQYVAFYHLTAYEDIGVEISTIIKDRGYR